jgi:hypothetical protein
VDEVARQRGRRTARHIAARVEKGEVAPAPLVGLFEAVRRRDHHAWRIETIGRLQAMLLPE